ncbi:DUF7576 family protein [Halosimplex amylolyticum]|uniref:DUF7576 family protein n=1 Tax=Halosimplex amylolyticum TaxID=3396616 RepID=UPI003F56EB2E
MDCPSVDGAARRPATGGPTDPSRSHRRTRCTNCGTGIALGAWHSAAVPTDGDRVYPFCRAGCRSAWLAARGEPDDSP